jgi:CrcB protein
VNLSGAFALGLITGAALSGEGTRLLGTGLLGAYTTFSTWAFEAHRQAEDGRTRGGLANLAVSLVLGPAAAWLGRRLGTAL